MKLLDLQSEIVPIELPAFVSVVPGAVRSDLSFSCLAGEPLGGHRAVSFVDGLLFHFNATSGIVGITLGACLVGHVSSVLIGGVLSDVSLSFVPGKSVFARSNGTLSSELEPGLAFVCVVGYALTTTSMVVSIHPSVYVGV